MKTRSPNAALGARQSRGEIAVLVHNTDGGVAGPLAGVIAPQLARASEAVRISGEAAAQSARMMRFTFRFHKATMRFRDPYLR